jgi:hypothetical protein
MMQRPQLWVVCGVATAKDPGGTFSSVAGCIKEETAANTVQRVTSGTANTKDPDGTSTLLAGCANEEATAKTMLQLGCRSVTIKDPGVLLPWQLTVPLKKLWLITCHRWLARSHIHLAGSQACWYCLLVPVNCCHCSIEVLAGWSRDPLHGV